VRSNIKASTRGERDQQGCSASVIYVAPNKSAKVQDGLSWATAFSDLQAAIDVASVSMPLFGLSGTYQPAKKDDRIAAFTLYDGVKLYGGLPEMKALSISVLPPGRGRS